MTAPNRIRTLIVDDEPPAQELIARLLAAEPDVEVLARCGSGREAVAAIERLGPDLVFLDVQMPELDGFGVLANARPAVAPIIVFVTAFDRHAVRAFEVSAFDYILKPFEFDRVRQALERVRERLRERASADMPTRIAALLESAPARAGGWDRIAVYDQKRTVFVKPAEIDWVASEGNYVRLHCGKASHLHRETLAAMEERLAAQGFVRVSRSAIVRLERICERRPLFHGDSLLILEGGMEIAASRNYREQLDRLLGGGSQ
jgi:two-component system LytT family response regulator